jgi:cell division protein FtsA
MVKKHILGVDIGTASIKALFASADGAGNIVIKSSGIVPSAGFDKGIIVDVAKLALTIREAVECAVMAANLPVTDIYLGISGQAISSTNSIGSVAPELPGAITAGDIERACRAASLAIAEDDHQLLQVIPTGYWINGEMIADSPVGCSGERLEVEAHVVRISQTIITELTSQLAAQGLKIAGVIASSIAGAQAIAAAIDSPAFLVLDIGAGLTDLTLYNDGKIRMSGSLPLGGNYITSDIKQGLGVEWSHAEEIKRYYSKLDKRLCGQDVILDCNDSSTSDKQVSYDFLHKIIDSRVEEIVSLVFGYLEPVLTKYPIDKLILAGGCAALPDISEYCERIFKVPVQIERLITQLPSEYACSANTACFGLLRYAAPLVNDAATETGTWRSLLKKLKEFI